MKQGYKKTELGWIPEEWEIKQLNDISEIIMGQSPDSDTYNDSGEGVPFFQGKTEFGRMSPIIKKWCTKPTKIAKPLDILVSVRAPVGEVNINVEDSCIGRGLAAIRGKNSNYKFIYYYMQSIKTKLNSSAQGSTFTAINSNDLKEVKIIVPPLKEQEKIADIIATVDSQIDDTDKLIEKTKELRKGLMQRLLTKGIGHREFKRTDIGEIPATWKVKTLEDISANYKNSIVDGPFGSNLKTCDYIEKGILVMQSSYITGGKFELKDVRYISKDKAKELSRSSVKSGNLLMAKIGANFGAVEIIPKEIEYGILSSNSLKIDLDGEVAINEFYLYILKNYRDIGIISKLASVTAQPALSLKTIKGLEVVVPSIEEQKKISQILLSIDTQIGRYENKMIKLEEIKKGLMQQLLTGKVRVRI